MLEKQDMSNRALRQEWESILIEQSNSGQTKKAFCEGQGLNVATFYYWQRRLRTEREDNPTGFHRVILQSDHELTVCLSNREVVLRSGSISTLAQVIKELVDA